jgi:hypothetical protein
MRGITIHWDKGNIFKKKPCILYFILFYLKKKKQNKKKSNPSQGWSASPYMEPGVVAATPALGGMGGRPPMGILFSFSFFK